MKLVRLEAYIYNQAQNISLIVCEGCTDSTFPMETLIPFQLGDTALE